MNATLVVIKKIKAAIEKLKRQIAYGIRNARKYILKLVDCEARLASIQIPSNNNFAPVQLSLLDAMSIKNYNLSNTGKFSQEWRNAKNKQDEYFNNLSAKKPLRDWNKAEITEYDSLEAETVFWAEKMHSEPVASVDPKVQADDDKYAKSRGYSNMNEMIGRF